jgi:hypothetical protein
VAFDPMPRSNDPRPVEEDFTPKPSTPPTDPSTSPQSATPVTASAVPSAPTAAHAGGPSGVVVASSVSGSVLVVLAAAAGVVVLMRQSLRRRRLFEGSPDARIEGAWSEFTDASRLAGRPVPPHLAATEAAAYAAEPVPPPRGLLRRAAPSGTATLERPEADSLPPLDELVAGINTVGFAPGAADNVQAESAGAQVVAYANALREQLPWWRRLWWTVHPGPLRWRRSR